MSVVEIDGSLHEGGGQILRLAVALSALRATPIYITNIRAKRNKPGLREQHLRGIQLVRDLTQGNLTGDSLGSTELTFRPGSINGGNYKCAVKTAGSISLILQVALPCMLFANAPTRLTIQGGTNAEMAPQIEYTINVFRPLLKKFGGNFELELVRRGFFPKGGGEVIVEVTPVKELNGVELLDAGNLSKIYGWSFVAGTLPVKLANVMADVAGDVFRKDCRNVEIERFKEDRNKAPHNEKAIILAAETTTGCILGSSALGRRNEPIEQSSEKAAKELLKTIKTGACLDDYNQDQAIILMALAKGPSKIRVADITLHTKTAIFVVEKLTKRNFSVTSSGEGNIIECCADS